jgi:Fur family ferric uptake transcriptional regulator
MLYGKLPVSVDECKKHIADALRDVGLHDAKKAHTIVDVFMASEAHLTAEDLQVLLDTRGVKLETKIIDRALTLLAEYGFANEISFEGEKAKRYEHLHPQEHHDHFICVKCKKVLEFRDPKLEEIQDSLIFRKGCKPLFHKLEVYGICDQCGTHKKKPVPITYAKEDTSVRLASVEGTKVMKKRLTELGFIDDEEIHIVKNSHFGPVILEVKGARLAIGRGQAQKIMVYE